MDKNFKVRMIVGAGMFIVAIVALYTFEAIPFKIIFGLFALMAMVELLSFFKKKRGGLLIFLALLEIVFLICSTVFVAMVNPANFWYIILGVPGYDIFAYLFGKMIGGKIFKKSRPFPKVSKNKTWEGTICGLIMAVSMVAILIATRGSFATDWMYLLSGPLALAGDLYESYLKRKFSVKDSGEIVISNKFFRGVEMLIGGSEGHGGFLDRIDSTAFAATVLLIIGMVI